MAEMMFYNERKKLASMFEKWAKVIGARDCAQNVIAYLMCNGLIDCEKARELINREIEE